LHVAINGVHPGHGKAEQHQECGENVEGQTHFRAL
jgi:hypothetical protein